ncbi:MAG: alpha/beta hydrolase [Sphaerochaeta sp.]
MRKRPLKIILVSLLSLIAIFLLGFYMYTLDYSKSDDSVKTLISTSNNIAVDKNITTVTSTIQTDESIGLIFYPGGKVESSAYLPLLERISQRGITCFLVDMPLNLAIFDLDAATTVMDSHPEIDRWYLAGHSLGGAMASSYAKDNYENLDGLILLAAYPLNDAPIDTICIYGSFDTVLDQTKLDGVSNKFEISGGNHAYFGNYGKQKGDGVAKITREKQQDITLYKIMEFINK